MAKVNFKKIEKTFTKPSVVSLLIVIFVVFVGGFILNRLMGGGIMHEGYTNTNRYTLKYYYSDRCGHCKTFTPTWNKFSNKFNDTGNLHCEKIEAKNIEPSVNIKGYPTVILYKPSGDIEAEFNGERTLDGLGSFLKQHHVEFKEKTNTDSIKSFFSQNGISF